MRKNYLTSAFPVHTLVKLWKQDDEEAAEEPNIGQTVQPRSRQIIFINSAAALAAIPGYDAYTRMLLRPNLHPSYASTGERCLS